MFDVKFGETFQFHYDKVFSEEKLDLIDDYIDHFEEHGWGGWKGKISPSWKVPLNYHDAAERIAYAKKHNLYHVHFGLPSWTNSGYGYSTSDQVIHFQKIDYHTLRFLSISTHNPMDLPTEDLINEE